MPCTTGYCARQPEFDNFRKRTERARREQHEAAGADVLADLLEIVDDLERRAADAGRRRCRGLSPRR